LSFLQDKQNDIQPYLKKNRIKFKKDPDHAIMKIAAYYDKITN